MPRTLNPLLQYGFKICVNGPLLETGMSLLTSRKRRRVERTQGFHEFSQAKMPERRLSVCSLFPLHCISTSRTADAAEPTTAAAAAAESSCAETTESV